MEERVRKSIPYWLMKNFVGAYDYEPILDWAKEYPELYGNKVPSDYNEIEEELTARAIQLRNKRFSYAKIAKELNIDRIAVLSLVARYASRGAYNIGLIYDGLSPIEEWIDPVQ